jgi:uncharacterized protein (TIGR02611 family)
MKKAFKVAKQALVVIVGGVVLLVGLAMIVLPGPAVVVIPLGLAILSTEIPIARRWYRRARVWIGRKLPILKRFAARVKGWRPRRRRSHSRA